MLWDKAGAGAVDLEDISLQIVEAGDQRKHPVRKTVAQGQKDKNLEFSI